MPVNNKALFLSLILQGDMIANTACFLLPNHLSNGLAPPSMNKIHVSSLRSSTESRDSEKQNMSLAKSSSFDNFDYLSHWYPVIWARDLEIDTPTKVSLFDVDYVVAKINKGAGYSNEKARKMGEEDEVVAMVDICPHKKVELSEGRITKDGNFQCAYHGWKFDATTGACLEIPHVERLPGVTAAGGTNCDGTAVPAMISNGMVWLFPGGGLEQAMMNPPPPEIPELKKEGYEISYQAMRDFPVDWTILIENIMDPDHGLFAHQTVGFDWYSASKTDPITLEENEINNGKGFVLTSKVKANHKLLRRDEEKRLVEKKKYADKDDALIATTTFHAPTFVYMRRLDENTEPKMISAFFVSPAGTGKSRFLSAQISKDRPKWLKVPRWLGHILSNNFLDQDTFLLSNQQKHVLAAESQLSLDAGVTCGPKTILPVRKKMYKYRSPSEKLGIRLGKWLDKTICRVPNRTSRIRNLGGYEPALLALSKTREEVLDRYNQHTRICKESMDTVRNCQKIRFMSKCVAILPVIMQTIIFGIQSVSSEGMLPIMPAILHKMKNPLRPSLFVKVWILAGILSYFSQKIEREFKFKYTDEHRIRDMKKIPGLWMD